ncbi:MAG: response regulator [Ilumatobacteraceae bacterium]
MDILIVDDQASTRGAVRRILARNHTISEAGSAAEAREQLLTNHYDLLLCDLKMPEENGFDLVRTMVPQAPNTVVVMVTGVDDPRIADEALALGVYGYLVKPFTTNEVLIAVATALRRRTLELERLEMEEQLRRLRELADRERIGRDLHDKVIQRLFATGMALQSARPRATDATLGGQLDAAINDLDETIGIIRPVIFDADERRSSGVRGAILDLAHGSAGNLGFEPTVRFHGPLDTLVTGRVADELLATLREALSNIVRHAAADHVAIVVDVADDEITLSIYDDGVGVHRTPGRPGSGLGLANMNTRAGQLGGSMVVDSDSRGTRLVWRVPLGHLATSTD